MRQREKRRRRKEAFLKAFFENAKISPPSSKRSTLNVLPDIDHKARDRKMALQYFESHPEAKRAMIQKGLVLLKDELDSKFGPSDADGIKEIIHKEEELYFKMLERNRLLIQRKYNDPSQFTGSVLAFLQTTHGCDPTMIEDILGIQLPEHIHSEFMIEIEKHRAISRAAHKPQVVTAK